MRSLRAFAAVTACAGDAIQFEWLEYTGRDATFSAVGLRD